MKVALELFKSASQGTLIFLTDLSW